MESIFKAYDIRGIYGANLTDEIAEAVGKAFVAFLRCRKVVVGRDIRLHSDKLFRALARGLTAQGADVIDIGLCSTPMCYFANGSLGADGGIMITASHNPGNWNGFKLCREKAIPISGQTGIKDLQQMVECGRIPPPAGAAGKIASLNIAPRYAEHIKSRVRLERKIRIAADYANAMGIFEAEPLRMALDVDPMFDTPDGSFPNHEANPLKPETLSALQQRVRAGGYDFGVAFDGDADRVGFVDETGEIVPMDIITAIIAKNILQTQKGKVLYDLRSSRVVRETIEENGGMPLMCRVGHAFIKQQMRAEDAVFAGELSGHYYFRDNYFTESAALAVLHMAAITAETGQPLSALAAPLLRYAKSPEINVKVRNRAAAFQKLRDNFKDGRLFELDGMSIEFPDWWFNIRPSNTEPLVRLNIEAQTHEQLDAKREELLRLLADT